jgi:hypothetical protein
MGASSPESAVLTPEKILLRKQVETVAKANQDKCMGGLKALKLLDEAQRLDVDTVKSMMNGDMQWHSKSKS